MFNERYQRRKKELLGDLSINSENRKLFKTFLEKEEKRAEMINKKGLLDDKNYKTLYFKIGRLIKLNEWFGNKDFKKLNDEEIINLIKNLHRGEIINQRTKKRISDRSLYYQMLSGRLFRIINKDNIAKEYLEEYSLNRNSRDDKENDVRFIEEEDFRKLVDVAISPEQKCLLWLAFDIGENIDALLKLEKSDFEERKNEYTKEKEYVVTLKKDDLKRSRTARREVTNYPETTRFLDIVLNNLKDSNKVITNKYMKNKKLSEIYSKDKLFKFGYQSAERFMKRCAEKTGVVCKGTKKDLVTFKDLRSSMACDLLRKGWVTDEIKKRLGHTPSSRMIDKYVNYLALDKNEPKKKVYESNLKDVEAKLNETKDLTKLQAERLKKQSEQMVEMQKMMLQLKKQYENLYSDIALEEMRSEKGFGSISDEEMLPPNEEIILKRKGKVKTR